MDFAVMLREMDVPTEIMDSLPHFLQFENEFRRFAVKRGAITSYQEFFQFVQNVHRLYEIPFSILGSEGETGSPSPVD